MNILSLDNLAHTPFAQGSVVTIGNFDGCHLGHQMLLALTLKEAKERQAHPIAVTFSPHPEIFFGRLRASDRLHTDHQKLNALRQAGMTEVVLQTFDQSFALRSAEWFLETGLIKRLNAKAVVVGGNFRFGAGRRGDVAFMKDFLIPRGLEVLVCNKNDEQGEAISSSSIRRHIQAGEVEAAALKLGYCYELAGNVVVGKKLGRTIGFPTANISEVEQLMPKNGVYAVQMILRNGDSVVSSQAGVGNIGVRPTVDNSGAVTLEVHVFDEGANIAPDGLYGQSVGVVFLKRLRDEKKFVSLEELKNQIGKDIKIAKNLTQGS